MRRVRLFSVLMLTLSAIVFIGCHKAKMPTVVTSPVTNVTATRCVAGGVVTSTGDGEVVERGVCWGLDAMPEIASNHLPSGAGLGTFTCEISGLQKGVTYYVRAYALSNVGTGYGESVSFTTLTADDEGEDDGGDDSGGDDDGDDGGDDGGDPVGAPEGAINGLFSVSSTEKVYFSKGNLQYKASTNTWRFADYQFDWLGTANQNISATNDWWIDLFGWGTSNHNAGSNCYQPWSTSMVSSDYFIYGTPIANLLGSSDWGYNPIINGGGQPNQWRTLTKDEWYYVLYSRTTVSGVRYVKAIVRGATGVVLLPDDFNTSFYSLQNTDQPDADYSNNTIDYQTWSTMEQQGAVFLPCAGFREIIIVDPRHGKY